MTQPRLPEPVLRISGASTLAVFLVLVLGTSLVLVPGLAAQDAESPMDGSETAMEGEGDPLAEDGAAAAEDDVPDIDEILEGEEAVLGGGGFTYDPGDRRDPFKSLLEARENTETEGPRPEGVPGLLVDEILVSGIFNTAQGWVAQVQSAEQGKSYLIKVGDQLYDGDVLSMSRNEVVFKQIVQDPAALKPFREVVKKLNP